MSELNVTSQRQDSLSQPWFAGLSKPVARCEACSQRDGPPFPSAGERPRTPGRVVS